MKHFRAPRLVRFSLIHLLAIDSLRCTSLSSSTRPIERDNDESCIALHAVLLPRPRLDARPDPAHFLLLLRSTSMNALGIPRAVRSLTTSASCVPWHMISTLGVPPFLAEPARGWTASG